MTKRHKVSNTIGKYDAKTLLDSVLPQILNVKHVIKGNKVKHDNMGYVNLSFQEDFIFPFFSSHHLKNATVAAQDHL